MAGGRFCHTAPRQPLRPHPPRPPRRHQSHPMLPLELIPPGAEVVGLYQVGRWGGLSRCTAVVGAAPRDYPLAVHTHAASHPGGPTHRWACPKSPAPAPTQGPRYSMDLSAGLLPLELLLDGSGPVAPAAAPPHLPSSASQPDLLVRPATASGCPLATMQLLLLYCGLRLRCTALPLRYHRPPQVVTHAPMRPTLQASLLSIEDPMAVFGFGLDPPGGPSHAAGPVPAPQRAAAPSGPKGAACVPSTSTSSGRSDG